MVREESGNLRKREESQGKSQGILTVCPDLKAVPLLRFSLMISVLLSAILKSHRKFSEFREKSGKMKVEKSVHPVKTITQNFSTTRGIMLKSENSEFRVIVFR